MNYSIIRGGKPVYDLLVKESKRVRDKSLFDFILQGAEKSHISTVIDFCSYLKKQNDNHNDNDNENDTSWYDTQTHRNTNRPSYSGSHPSKRDGDNIFLQIAKEEGLL